MQSLTRRCAISAEQIDYANLWHEASPALAFARQRASELKVPAVSATGAGLIEAIVAATSATAVVEVGTGAGSTGIAALAGLRDGGILTTIDADGHHQAAAKDAYREAGHDSSRARLITGSSAEVLPRLADAAYDVVIINELDGSADDYLDQIQRLLRTGGAVVVTSAITANRDIAALIRDNDLTTATLLPIDDGIVIGIKLGESSDA